MGPWEKLGLDEEQYQKLVDRGMLESYEADEARLDEQRALLEKNRSYEARKQLANAEQMATDRFQRIEDLKGSGFSEDEARGVESYRDQPPPEAPLEDEGLFDIYKPYKRKLMADMKDAGLSENQILAFDMLTPDGPSFVSFLKKTPAILTKIKDGDKIIDFMKAKKRLERAAKKTDTPRNIAGMSRNEKIEEALRRQREKLDKFDDEFDDYAEQQSRDQKIWEALGKQREKQRDEGLGFKSRSDLRKVKIPKKEKMTSYEAFVDRYSDKTDEVSKKTRAAVEQNASRIMDEPYSGRSFENVLYADPKLNDLNLAQPIPSFGEISVRGHLGKNVAKGGADPFAYIDFKYGLTKNVLDKNFDKRLKISTRSDLIAHDEYMARLNPKKHKIVIHIPNLNNRMSKVIEPGAPSVKRRLAAAKKLKDNGFNVQIMVDDIKGVPNEILGDYRFLNGNLVTGDNDRFDTVWNKIELDDKQKDLFERATGIPIKGED